jgi:hypothetical protein
LEISCGLMIRGIISMKYLLFILLITSSCTNSFDTKILNKKWKLTSYYTNRKNLIIQSENIDTQSVLQYQKDSLVLRFRNEYTVDTLKYYINGRFLFTENKFDNKFDRFIIKDISDSTLKLADLFDVTFEFTMKE